ncbi:hypothetical protein [Bradyrhizobium sp. RT6a]|uniref:hypothetical protein n=1 Tax=Bradyrhizobium sp. RT6a TaxID=3156381 RepID=UPI00339687B2
MLGTQTVNVLNKVPVSVQATMKKDFARSIGREPSVRRTRDRRLRREAFAKYGRAVERLVEDRDTLLAF